MIPRCSLLIILLLYSSCSLFTRKGSWGKNAIYPVKWEGVKKSFIKNITSRHVWVPATAGLIIHSAGYDNKISDWATSDSLFFRDEEAADRYSDTLNNILEIEMYGSIFFTSSSSEKGDWKQYSVNKAKGATVVYSSAALAHGTTSEIKNKVYRERPDGSDGRSFPSGHATDASAYRMVISRNLESTPMPSDLRDGINILNGGITTAALWARVEANAHYPSDALLGYSVGSFVSGFIYDAFMNLDDTESLVMFPSGDGGMVTKYTFYF